MAGFWKQTAVVHMSSERLKHIQTEVMREGEKKNERMEKGSS